MNNNYNYSRKSNFLTVSIALFLACTLTACYAVVEDDVRCLEGLKSSLNDPQGNLSSWSFKNTSEGSICKFVGVTCWDDRENRIFGIELREMKLSGTVPKVLEYCGSLQILDLSGNNLNGSISNDTCTWLPFLVTLDLSHNELLGPIPTQLAKCSYLNTLMLSDNKLFGNWRENNS
jgi:Leucine-rich repeat (LRR) protein